MDEFAELVERCRNQKLQRVIENTSMQHATILLQNLFSHATSERSDVQIVSGQLHAPVFAPVLGHLKKSLEVGCKVEAIVICADDDLRGNAFRAALESHPNGTVHVAGRRPEDHIHFLVTDKAYRLEVDDAAKKAYASFNDKDQIITNYLRQTFARWKEKLGVGAGSHARPVGAD